MVIAREQLKAHTILDALDPEVNGKIVKFCRLRKNFAAIAKFCALGTFRDRRRKKARSVGAGLRAIQNYLFPFVRNWRSYAVAEIPAFLAVGGWDGDVTEVRFVLCLVAVDFINCG